MRLHSETSALILNSWDHYQSSVHELSVRAFQILFLKHPETRNDIAAIDRLPLLVSDGLAVLVQGLEGDSEDAEKVIEALAETLVHTQDDSEDLLGRYLASFRACFIEALKELAPPSGFRDTHEYAWESLFAAIEARVSHAKQAVLVSHRRSEKAQRLGFLVN